MKITAATRSEAIVPPTHRNLHDRSLASLPTALLELIFDYLSHCDVVTVAVCSLEWPTASPFEITSLKTLWPRPLTPLALLHKAASYGCWTAAAYASLQVAKRHRMEHFPPWVLYDAVRRSDLQTVETLHPQTRYDPYVAMEIAGRAGNLELVEWLFHHSRSAKSPSSSPANQTVIDLLAGREETAPLGFEYVNWNVHVRTGKKNATLRFCASRDGLLPNLPMLAASSKHPYPLFAFAVSVGDFPLVDKLLQQASSANRLVSFEHTLSLAAANGKLDVVRWLLSTERSSLEEIPQAMVSAAQHGHLETLVFLHDTIITLSPSGTINLREQEQLRVAALHGHVSVVQFLVTRLCVDVTAQVFDNAARQGHKDVIIWLADHGGNETILPTTILRAAVFGGNVELVRWLVEDRQCPVYREAAVHAAEENRLDVLKWLHAYALKQAPNDRQHLLDYASISIAALRCQGSIDCATWLLVSVPWVDPTYSGRDLRSLDRWYESALRNELSISYRNDPPALDHYHVSDASVSKRRGIDRFMMTLLRHRPQAAVSVKWLPRWAVWTRSIEALELLDAMHHRWLWTARTVRAALTFTTDGELVNWLERRGRSTFERNEEDWHRISQSVRKWATKTTEPKVCFFQSHAHPRS